MPEVFLLSASSHQKILKFIQRKLKGEGIRCEILTSPRKAIKRVKKCFHLYYKDIPKLKSLKVADFNLDPETYELSKIDKKVKLRKKEFELLQFFISNKNKIINRNTILENVWGPSCNPFTNTVDVHIASLRKKVNTGEHKLLRTIHGVGYKFEI